MAARTSLVKAVVLLVVCTIVAVSRCRAGLQHTCSRDQTPRGTCGQNLSNLLSMVCRSGYNKRGGNSAGMQRQSHDGTDDSSPPRRQAKWSLYGDREKSIVMHG